MNPPLYDPDNDDEVERYSRRNPHIRGLDDDERMQSARGNQPRWLLTFKAWLILVAMLAALLFAGWLVS